MAVNPLFERATLRATQQAKSQEDEAIQALRRRLAAMGGLQGGAGLKMEEQIRQKTQEQLGGQLEDIRAQEAQFNLQQQEAEKARQFQAQESALARGSQEQLLGRQLASQRELQQMGQQFTAGESALQRAAAIQAQREGQQFTAGESALERQARLAQQREAQAFTAGQQISQNEFAAIESKLGREAAMKLQESAQSHARTLADLDASLRREGILSQEKLNQANLDANAKLESLKLDYAKAKDQADRTILEKQMKNELTMALVSQGAAFAELAKVGLAPSELASMVNSFIGGAIAFNPDGTIRFNQNWNPSSVNIAPASNVETRLSLGGTIPRGSIPNSYFSGLSSNLG